MKTFCVARAKRLSISHWNARIAIVVNYFVSFAAKEMTSSAQVAPMA
jgi:hypothetical protein